MDESLVDTPGDLSELDYSGLQVGANLANLERGRVYYAQLCVSCHGVRGKGDGEWAYRVRPHPGDLTAAGTQRRDDAYLTAIISDGQVGTSMPGWSSKLTEHQIRQVVEYIRYLGGGKAREVRVDT